MSQVSPEFVERYQIEYQKNPRSRIFAPLAEAYRKMGLLEEAHRVCQKGVQLHPDFSGGHVAFAKVLIDMNRTEEALVQLEHAVRCGADNLLAHSLMGETLMKLRRPKDALKAFKMVLFLNPDDEKAKAIVKKWEFLSADDYDDELFSMRPTFIPEPETKSQEAQAVLHRGVERAISLADAFTVRNEPDRALSVLLEARAHWGISPEIDKRIELLSRRTSTLKSEPDYVDLESRAPGPVQAATEARRQKLEVFLRRINDRRHGG